MMKRRHEARFFAFDLLWLNGEDLRGVPLLTRKATPSASFQRIPLISFMSIT